MALKRPEGPTSGPVVLKDSSQVLKGNPLGDPHVRKFGVCLPLRYDGGRRRRYPV
jgi:hypothetical protein